MTPWTVARQASHHQLPEFTQTMSIESVMASNHLILCHPLFLPPSIVPSIRVFSNESVLRIRWPKDWSFSISLSSEYSGLISFRMDWLDLLAVQGTLKSLLQHHSSKASIFWRSAVFRVHSHYWNTFKPQFHRPREAMGGLPPPQPLCWAPDPASPSGPMRGSSCAVRVAGGSVLRPLTRVS